MADSLYVDAKLPAVLTHGGTTVKYPSTQEATVAFALLTYEEQRGATITVGKIVYCADEIVGLQFVR